MDVVVAGTVAMEQAAFKQVGLTRRGRLVYGDSQIVITCRYELLILGITSRSARPT
jgi:hypothetical protein